LADGSEGSHSKCISARSPRREVRREYCYPSLFSVTTRQAWSAKLHTTTSKTSWLCMYLLNETASRFLSRTKTPQAHRVQCMEVEVGDQMHDRGVLPKIPTLPSRPLFDEFKASHRHEITILGLDVQVDPTPKQRNGKSQPLFSVRFRESTTLEAGEEQRHHQQRTQYERYERILRMPCTQSAACMQRGS
jgi:hypothetical protein